LPRTSLPGGGNGKGLPKRGSRLDGEVVPVANHDHVLEYAQKQLPGPPLRADLRYTAESIHQWFRIFSRRRTSTRKRCPFRDICGPLHWNRTINLLR
jgi:hypothetical protein